MAITLAPQVAIAAESPTELFRDYRDAIAAEDWSAAAGCWHRADRAAAGRLGVSYPGHPLKLGSASRLILMRDEIADGRVAVTLDRVSESDARATVLIRFTAGSESVVEEHFAIRDDGAWRWAAPTSALSANWERQVSEYLDIRTPGGDDLSAAAVRTLDRFVATTCARLGVSPQRLARLRQEKILYYHGDPAFVERVAGAPTRGVAVLQVDAVATSEPCHLHELAHLLINFALEDPPLYTLPLLQEGAAVHLGGRWGRGAAVTEAMGRFLLVGGMLAPEDLFAWADFESQGADWTYAPAGVVAGHLLEQLGGPGFLSLYRRCSGPVDSLRSLDAAAVATTLASALGTDRTGLAAGIAEYAAVAGCGGLESSGAITGTDAVRIRGDGLDVRATRDAGRMHWQVASEAPALAILAKEAKEAKEAAGPHASSRLFAEQFPDRERRGEVLALVVRPGEVGLYDFRTDMLLAKYVADFCTDRAPLEDAEGVLRFQFPSSLLDSVSDLNWEAVLP